MRQGWLNWLVMGLLALAATLGGLYSSTVLAQQNWEPAIRAFEQHDKARPVPPGGIVFTGSSSIARWASLADDMKPLPVINRGFGGSQFTDVNQYAERIVVAYRPKIVVVYAGDNDLAEGSPKTPESVMGDVQKFVQIVHSKLPETWIYVISIKPSVLRWNAWPKMKEANALIQDFVGKQERVQYIDVATPMFDAQGNLPRDLFVEDGLHPTAKLYAMWTAIIKPILSNRFAAAQIRAASPLGVAAVLVLKAAAV
jgi:lysophospholipase L1-like esterase